MVTIGYPQVADRLAMFGYPVTEQERSNIEFEIKLVLNYVVNYCNFTSENDIPVILENRIIDRICSEFLNKKKNSGSLEGFNYDAFVKTIKEGDTQIQFGNESDGETVESRFDKFVDYMTRGFDKWLAVHRRIRW